MGIYFSRATACLLLIAVSSVVRASDRRLYRVDDELESESVAAATFAPDGKALAFVRYRPRKRDLGRFGSPFVHPENRADVWLQAFAGELARNLTNGETDHSGAWEPQWSPDGKRLAFLSSRGGSVRVWAWESTTNRIHPLSSQAVDLEHSCKWIDSVRLICQGPSSVMSSPPLSRQGEVAAGATAAWEKARQGALTASVLDSTEFKPVTKHLYLIDSTAQDTREVATTAAAFRSPSWWAAPDGRTVAVAAPTTKSFSITSLIRLGVPGSIQLHSLDGRVIRLDRPLPDNVITSTLKWSHDGTELAFFAYDNRDINPLVLYGASAIEVMPEHRRANSVPLKNPARLYRVTLDSGQVREIATGEIDFGWLGAPVFSWTADGDLLFYAPRTGDGTTTWNNIPRMGVTLPNTLGPSPQKLWWLLNRSGKTSPLIPAKIELPDRLDTVDNGATFVGIKDGEVLRVTPRTREVRNLTSNFAPEVRTITLISGDNPPNLLLMHARAVGDSLSPRVHVQEYLLDLRHGTVLHIAKPSPEASVIAFSSTSLEFAYNVDDYSGLRLWRSGPTGVAETVAEANTYRRNIIYSERRTIDFTSLNGEKLKAVLLLPPDYVVGRRYPLVVSAYSGRTETAVITESQVERHNTLGAAGYALVFPEIPRNVKGLDAIDEGSSFLSSVNAVVPVAQQVVALGIADPDRLFLYGFSFGGWTVAHALAQTTLFKAAVAASGVYYDEQLFGQTGSMQRGLMRRYEDASHDWVSQSTAVKAYFPTDMPWWRDLTRINRNSPLSYADRIQTPLLLIHGDLDSSAYIEQSESMFNALVSMRKRAQFVRYWGEGHIFVAQANRRDFWQRILAWYDEHGDVLRDQHGRMVFEGERIKARGNGPPLKPEYFSLFGPAAPVAHPSQQPSETIAQTPK